MFWIIQENLDSHNRREELILILERLGIDFLKMNLKNYTFNHEIDEKQAIITNGSILLSEIAKQRNWSPGSMFNENFSYNIWKNYYNDLLLNKNAKITTLKEANINNQDKIFVRPVLDNKTFNGKVFEKEEFLDFKKKYLELYKDNQNIEILISIPKVIGQEHRHYIVGKEIVTSSRYKLSGQTNYKEGCDDRVLEVVQKAINIWTPAPAFVLDTYISGNEIGIVEIGCICHAGLYNADLMKLVYSLDNMKLDNKPKMKK